MEDIRAIKQAHGRSEIENAPLGFRAAEKNLMENTLVQSSTHIIEAQKEEAMGNGKEREDKIYT